MKMREVDFGVWDFTTLYLSLDHDLVVNNVKGIVARIYAHQRAKGFRLLSVSTSEGGKAAWAEERGNAQGYKYYDEEEFNTLMEYIVRHAFVVVGDTVYRQTSGIPMGFGASPMIAIFTLAYQAECCHGTLLIHVGV
jgi:hypothetical protein